MNKSSLTLAALLACLYGLPALATNDIEPTKEFYSALRTSKPIVLDGNLSEWSGAPVLADPKFAVPKYSGTNASPNYVLFEQYSGGTWTGPDDQTSAVQVVYDDDNVYFGFVVTDDYHENISGNAWDGDSIQLMIADETRTTQVALYNYALGGYEDDTKTFVPDPNLADPTNPVVVHHEAGPECAIDGTCATEAVIKRDSANKKTIYEIKLPVASLGLTGPLQAGVKFGLGMAINDGDGALVNDVQYGEAGQQGQKGWGGLGAHSIVFGKTASETALVTLATNSVSGGDVIFLSAITPGISTFTFRATDKGTSVVDPATAKLTVDGQVLTLTSKKSGDATDFSYSGSGFTFDVSHAYTIEVKDTTGKAVTDQGTFKIASRKIGLNFGAEEPLEGDPPGSQLLTEDVAGVPAVAQSHWNNLTTDQTTFTGTGGPSTTFAPNAIPGVLDDTGAATLVTVTWQCNNTWASTGKGEENNGFTGADRTLMTGYLDTGDPTTTTVRIEGIPDELMVGAGYDVYVYALGGVANKGGGYRIVDTNGTVLKPYMLATADANPSTYKEIVSDGKTRGTGSYMVFKGLKSPAIVVEASTDTAVRFGDTARAPINAIQLVPSKQAAGSTSVSVVRSGNSLTIQWSPAGGTLESSPSLGGTVTWTAVGTANPATVQIGAGNTFYRVRQ